MATLPLRPGVYRFLDGNGRVLYVGKAKSLKKRVSSYFVGWCRASVSLKQRGSTPATSGKSALSPRIQAMLNQARNLEITVTHTENEALILEANLIKRFYPPYNVLLKDDKSHPYLHLSTDHPYPRLRLLRGSRQGTTIQFSLEKKGDITASGRLFGPFPSVSAVRETLKWLQRIFPIRQCEDRQFKQRQRPCLQYQIKRCTAPCCARISTERYAELVRDISLFLEGKEKVLLELLKQSMWKLSESRAFEEAAKLRDRIKSIALVQDQRRVNLEEKCNLDLFGVAQDGHDFAVQVFFVRNGINLGNSSFFPENGEGLTAEEVLESFLSQYYAAECVTAQPTDEVGVLPSSSPSGACAANQGEKKGVRMCETSETSSLSSPPEEILLSLVLKQRQWLAAALSELRGAPVRIHKPTQGEKLRLMNMAVLNAKQALERHRSRQMTFDRLLRELADILALPHLPKRIEAYDVSHFQGGHPVGSLIVFGAEGWKKSAYRHYNLREPGLLDDTARMAHMLSRRFSRLPPQDVPHSPQDRGGPSAQRSETDHVFNENAQKTEVAEEKGREDGVWPDLILLDGGRGQLNAVLAVAEALPRRDLCFCAIAKGVDRHAGRERLFLPDRQAPIILPPDSPVLFLLQNIRDEAHRFAIGLHRAQRGRAQTRSSLDQISGIGPKRKRALLRHFGSVKVLREAGVSELLLVAGVSEDLAHRIVQFFQEDS